MPQGRLGREVKNRVGGCQSPAWADGDQALQKHRHRAVAGAVRAAVGGLPAAAGTGSGPGAGQCLGPDAAEG
ncbi:hypothetical protein D3C75_1068420 [compost metagenome]